ncbi:iron-SULFUR flavoprotein [Lachnospiraceae bacterium KM106-2]|nr:iron-SULFUR flavoprotein [Lachnospiraceae bacterium KM106-2]
MKYLVVNTITDTKEQVHTITEELKKEVEVTDFIDASKLKISGCIGCNRCWLNTPGICAIKDDYEKLLLKFLQVDRVIFLTDTRFGFISYQLKNIFDRILPLATMYLTFNKGQMRHIPRYKKKIDMGILYHGEGDKDYLNEWLNRAMLNLYSNSLGAYQFEQRKEFYHALNDH